MQIHNTSLQDRKRQSAIIGVCPEIPVSHTKGCKKEEAQNLCDVSFACVANVCSVRPVHNCTNLLRQGVEDGLPMIVFQYISTSI